MLGATIKGNPIKRPAAALYGRPGEAHLLALVGASIKWSHSLETLRN